MPEDRTVYKSTGMNAFGIGANVAEVDVSGDKIVRVRPMRYDKKYPIEQLKPWTIKARGSEFHATLKALLPPYAYAYKKRVYSDHRILHPYKRVDWDPHGERHPETRGISGYERIGWDEAAQICADEIRRCVDEYGPTSVFLQGDGHGETKVMHASHGCNTHLLNLLGGFTLQARQPDSWEGWYWGAKHMWGMDPVGQQAFQSNLLMDTSENSDAVLFVGCDPETTPWGWGGQMASKISYFWSEIGIRQIYICPDVNYGAAVHADKWIPVLPNTDAALWLGIAYTWIKEGTYDQEYLDTHAVGFENFRYYVMGGEDGVPKTPKWAEAICGVPSYTIKAFARYWAKHAVSIAHCNGGSFIRSCYAHEPARLEVALLGMQGVGKPGANQFKFIEWTLSGMESVTPLPPSTEIPDCSPAYRGWFRSFPKSFIPKTMIPEAIMNPPVTWYGHIGAGFPREDQFTGPFTFPLEGNERLHMIWSDTPCWETCWNGGNEMQEALRHPSIECIVVQHPWMENDCYFADVILPTNTKFETEDIGTDCDNGQWNVVFYERQAIKPIGESKSDKEAVGEVAKALEKFGGAYEGIYDKYVGGKTDEEWIKVGFDTSGVPEDLSYDEFKEKQYYPFPTREDWKEIPSGISGF